MVGHWPKSPPGKDEPTPARSYPCRPEAVTARDLRRLSDILGLNAARAVIAIEVIGDWSAYDDPMLGILIGMLAPVFKKVDASADFPMEPLTDKAQEELTTRLAETLVTNQAQIRQRRDQFVSTSSL
jgi:hypothetical protein